MPDATTIDLMPGNLASDLKACRALLRDGSRTFYAASFLLPHRVRAPATALYAFCRLADDAVDVHPGGASATLGGALALDRLRERLALVYAGRPLPYAADRAFAAATSRFDLPREISEALIEGFGWDVEGRRYEDLAALRAYAVRVAGAVGLAMALLMDCRSTNAMARACDLGVAMQLTNIARDVGEDARAGRLYLPLSWLREEGIDPDVWLARPAFDPRIARIVARLLGAADVLYERAESGIAALPAACRPGIRAARLLYASIGDEVRRLGFDSVTQRARVSVRRKSQLLARALAALPGERQSCAAPILPEARFLTAVVQQSGAKLSQPETRPAIGSRVVWVIELFERLEREQRSTS